MFLLFFLLLPFTQIQCHVSITCQIISWSNWNCILHGQRVLVPFTKILDQDLLQLTIMQRVLFSRNMRLDGWSFVNLVQLADCQTGYSFFRIGFIIIQKQRMYCLRIDQIRSLVKKMFFQPIILRMQGLPSFSSSPCNTAVEGILEMWLSCD